MNKEWCQTCKKRRKTSDIVEFNSAKYSGPYTFHSFWIPLYPTVCMEQKLLLMDGIREKETPGYFHPVSDRDAFTSATKNYNIFFGCVVDSSAHDIYRLNKSCCSDTIMGEILSFCGFCTKSGFTVCLFSGLHGWQMCFWFLVLTCMIFTMRVMWQGSKWKWWICFLFSQ